MKIKGLILIAFFALVSALTLSQSNLVSAQNVSPATSPVTYYSYQLGGKIVYRLVNVVIPAVNVKVVAKNVNSNESFTTSTDYTGYYKLTVNQASPSARYMIKPLDNLRTTWTPAQYNIIISKTTNNLNFTGTQATASAQTSF